MALAGPCIISLEFHTFGAKMGPSVVCVHMCVQIFKPTGAEIPIVSRCHHSHLLLQVVLSGSTRFIHTHR
jgi:hypothetical protein